MKKPEIKRVGLQDAKSYLGDGMKLPSGKFWAAIIDDEIIGIGGYAVVFSEYFVFLNLSEKAKQYPVTMIRAAKMALDDFTGSGRKRIYAIQDVRERTSDRLLSGLGFERRKDGLWLKGI